MTLGMGEKRIPFRLRNVDESLIASEELAQGAKAMAVIFSCNHCPYVLAWEDRMVALGKDYQSKGVVFVLINSNDAKKVPEDGFTEMGIRARLKAYPFPYLHDEDQSVARSYGATRTPEVFLFDQGGQLRYHGRIDDNYEDPKGVKSHNLRDAIGSLLAGKSPVNPDTSPIGCTIKWKA